MTLSPSHPMLRQIQPLDDTVLDGAVRNQQWVRIVFPGVTDERVRFEAPIGGLLSSVAADILDETPLLLIEQMTATGRTQQEVLLASRPLTTTRLERDDLSSDEAAECFDTLRENDVDRTTALLAAELEARLIGRLGLEVVTVDLRPVGTIPVQTNRLVGTSTDPITLGRSGTQSAFATQCYRLIQQGVPHLTRTRIAKTTADTYLVEQQLARFERTRQLLYGDDRADILESPPADLGSTYDSAAVTSSLQRLAATEWRSRTTGEGLRACHGAMPAHDDLAPAVNLESVVRTICIDEYAHLRGRECHRDRLETIYNLLGVTPTLQLDRASLTSVLGLVPNYENGQWFPDGSLARACPSIDSVVTIRDASGTDHDSLATGPECPPATSTAAELEGIDVWPEPPSDLLQAAIRGLREYGDTVEGHKFSPSKAALLRTTPDGLSEPVFVGTADTLSAGDLIAAAQRIGDEQGVTVVTASEADARWIFDVCRTPFRSTADTRTELYPCLTRYWTVDDGVLLRPSDESIEWWLSPDGEVTVTLDGTPLETGTVATPPVDPGAPLLSVTKEPSHYSVFHPDQGLLTTAASVDRLASTLSVAPIPLPVVPRYGSLLDRVTVFVVNDGTLTRVTPDLPGSDDDSEWYVAALEWFLNTYTSSAPDVELTADVITEQFRRYLRPQTAHRLPSAGRIDSVLRPMAGQVPIQSHRLVSQELRPTLSGRTWRYPLDSTRETLPESAERSPVMNRLAARLMQTIHQ